MNTLPTDWCIAATKENFAELYPWWRANAGESWERFSIGHTLMSSHPDGSCYFANCEEQCVKYHPNYQPITIEQFRQITNSTSTQKPMTKSIQISRDLLNEYYEASISEQRAYLSEHFKLDGTTTIEAIRGLHAMACSKWRPRIRKNHPECFPEYYPEYSKHFDFSNRLEEHGTEGLVSNDVVESLGIRSDFIQIRRSDNPKTNARSFYLTTDYNWELVQDGTETGGVVWVLIPTKKKS